MSSSSKLPEPLIFFLDRSLGNKIIATALRQAGVIVEIHDDHFSIDAKDEDWLPFVGKRGWIVLTKDRRIRYRTLEKLAVIKAKVAVFTLTAGDLQGAEMAHIFIKAIPVIRRFIAKNKPPFIARIARDGSISLVV